MNMGDRWRLRPAAAGVLLIALVAAAGCGGGGTAGTGTDAAATAGKSKAEREYIQEADAVCAKQRGEIRRMQRRYRRAAAARGLTGRRMAAGLVKTIAPALGYEVRSVRVLVLPRSDIDAVLRVLDSWQRQIEDAEVDPEGFVSASNPFARTERMAREFGFRVCGSL